MNKADEKLINIIKENLKGIGFRNRILVKPLKETMVTIETEEPVFKKDEKGDFIKDEKGFNVYEKTEKSKKTVPSDYRKGVVLKLPLGFKTEDFGGLMEGATILYPTKSALPFDHIKDSVFIDPYNIVAIYYE